MEFTLINIENVDGEAVAAVVLFLAWLLRRRRRQGPPPSNRPPETRPTLPAKDA